MNFRVAGNMAARWMVLVALAATMSLCRSEVPEERNCGGQNNQNCVNSLCDTTRGYCLKGCVAGFYGDGCEDRCTGHCVNDYDSNTGCDRADGRCINCKVGWYGDDCTKPCLGACDSTALTDTSCDRKSGRCLECGRGKYGDWCTKSCDTCALGQDWCDRNTGECGCRTSVSRENTPHRPNCFCDHPSHDNCTSCTPGWYSETRCNETCNGHCQDNGCHIMSGRCIKCKPGYTGEGCSDKCLNSTIATCNCPRDDEKKCDSCIGNVYDTNCDKPCEGHCDVNGCDKGTGQCFGCLKGWTGERCNDTCSGNCTDCYRNGGCTECEIGNFGTDCTEPCKKNCNDSEGCAKSSGDCRSCKPGFRGRTCEERCVHRYCKSELGCDIKTAECIECNPGRYGANCNKTCNKNAKCVNNICDKVKGICVECQREYFGRHCNETCPATCNTTTAGATCDRVFGYCNAGCQAGTYGPRCRGKCSEHCMGKLCNHVGTCVDGCEDGWYGEACDEQCSEHCPGDGNVCNQTNGHCICEEHGNQCSCEGGKYGPRCMCVGNCADDRCSEETGECERCAEGFYGNCDNSHTCGSKLPNCSQCILDGNDDVKCTVCNGATTGPNCTEDCPEFCNNSMAISAGVCKKDEPHKCIYGCKNGYFGDTCGSTCHTNCIDNRVDQVCEQITGECFLGCRNDTAYGIDCSIPCSEHCNYTEDDTICNRTGSCLHGCRRGWTETDCNISIDSLRRTMAPIIIGGVAGGIAFFVLLLPFVVCSCSYLSRQCQQKKSDDKVILRHQGQMDSIIPDKETSRL